MIGLSNRGTHLSTLRLQDAWPMTHLVCPPSSACEPHRPRASAHHGAIGCVLAEPDRAQLLREGIEHLLLALAQLGQRPRTLEESRALLPLALQRERTRNQHSSAAISGHQWPSVAINGHHLQREHTCELGAGREEASRVDPVLLLHECERVA